MRLFQPIRSITLGVSVLFGAFGVSALPAMAASPEECFRLDNDLERLLCIRRALTDTTQLTPEQAFAAFEEKATVEFRPSQGGHRFFHDDCNLYALAATADGGPDALVSSRRGQQRPDAFGLPRGLSNYDRVRLRALEINLADVASVSPGRRDVLTDITMRRGKTYYASTVTMALGEEDRPPVYASGRDATFVARQMDSMFVVFFDEAIDQRSLVAMSRSADALQASLNLPDELIAPAERDGTVIATFERRTDASRSGSWPFARGQADRSGEIFDAFRDLVTACQAVRR